MQLKGHTDFINIKFYLNFYIMYLNTRMQKPIIADRDIECYVYIRRFDYVKEEKKHGFNWLMHRIVHKCDPTGIIFTKFYEPYRSVELKPGTTATGKSGRVYSGEYNGRNHYRVDDGFVNAMLRADNYGVAVPYKATIPAGTEFYVNNGLFRIAARKIKISKEKVSVMPSWDKIIEPIKHILAEELFGNDDTIRPGFYYLSNGTYLNPNKLTEETSKMISGVVSDVNGIEISVMSLDEVEMPWCKLEHPTRVCSDVDVYAKGEDLMITLMRNEEYGDAFMPARWCTKYEVTGGLKGSWHMGSVQEVLGAVRENMLEINVALSLLDAEYDAIDSLSCYWTTVDYDDAYAYAIDGSDGVLIRSEKTSSNHKVRAFMTKIKPNPLFS